MKKVYLALSSLLAIGLLAACSGKGSDRDYIISEGKKVVNEEMMEANYNQNKSYGTKAYKSFEWKVPDGYTLEVDSFQQNGVYLLQKDGKYAIYSALGNKFLLDAKALNIYDIENDSVTGLFVKYNTSDSNYVLADGVGNKLYEGTSDFSYAVARTLYTDELDIDHSFLRVKITKTNSSTSENSYEFRYFEYDQTSLKATQIECPTYWRDDNIPAGEDYNVGTIIDLSKYGVKRTIKAFGTQQIGYTIVAYDEEGEEEATFRLNEGFKLIPYGCNFIAERVNETTSGGSQVKGASNFKVEHKFINLRSLKQSDVDLPAIIQNYSFEMLKPYELEDDEYYSTVTLQEVKEDGSLGDYRTMIIDEDFDLHDDITFKNFVKWTRLHNGYFYDQDNATVYDEEFNPVFSSSGLNLNLETETFVNSSTVVNLEGKRVFASRYRSFSNSNSLNGVFMASDTQSKKAAENEVLANAADGTVKTLENTTSVTESFISNAIGFIKRVETTSAGTKGALKTYDGQTTIATAEGFNSSYGFSFSGQFNQQGSIETEYRHSFTAFDYKIDSATKTSIVYNELLEVTTL